MKKLFAFILLAFALSNTEAHADYMSGGTAAAQPLSSVLATGNTSGPHDLGLAGGQKLILDSATDSLYLWRNPSFPNAITYTGQLNTVQNSTIPGLYIDEYGTGQGAYIKTRQGSTSLYAYTTGGNDPAAVVYGSGKGLQVIADASSGTNPTAEIIGAAPAGTVLLGRGYSNASTTLLYDFQSNYPANHYHNISTLRSDGHMSLGNDAAVSDTVQLYMLDTATSGIYQQFENDGAGGVVWAGYADSSSPATSDVLLDIQAKGNAALATGSLAGRITFSWDDVGTNEDARMALYVADDGPVNTAALEVFGGATDTIRFDYIPQWADPGSKPTCDASTRGATFYDAGAPGAADTFEACLKDASNNYAWTTLK